MTSSSRSRERRHETGLSLLEVLFAAVLLGAVAVSLAPLFVRSAASNVHGGTASQGLNHVRSFLSTLIAMPRNHPDLSVLDPGTPNPNDVERKIIDVYYDVGNLNVEGDERWLTSATDGSTDDYAIERRWDLEVQVQDFNAGDVGPCLISAINANLLICGGADPFLFDNPVPAGASIAFRHLQELSATSATRRVGGPLGTGQRITTRRFRSY